MAQFLKIDPTTKDYVFQNGSPVPSDSITNRAYFALLIPQSKWLYGTPDQGSLLYTLTNQKRSASIEQLLSSYIQVSLQSQLIANGYANQTGFNNIVATSSGSSNQISIVPTAVPVQSNLNFVSV
jgi:phage gp46-like protein